MNDIALRTALLLLAVSASAGCALAGERVGGICPAGETCSDQTPNGLFFLGAATADSFGGGVGATAAGGTQTINVQVDSSLGSPAFDRAFDAATVDTKVATVQSTTPPTVVVRGAAAGTTQLRLLESGTDKLLDRVDLEVASIDKATLFPEELFLLIADDAQWALFAGGTAPMIVKLEAADGERLIDEGMSVTPASGSEPREAWDVFELTAPATGNADFTVEAGKGSFTASAPVVTTIDGIVTSQRLGGLSDTGTIEALQDHPLCFLSTSGDVPTVGATWKFTGTETIAIAPPDAEKNTHTSCVTLQGTAVGPAQLTVEASGFTRVIDLDFVKGTSRKRAGQARDVATRHLRAATAGERAGGI